jgi:Arc/MetJ-type ribon-helix-helix transcriptional regulator
MGHEDAGWGPGGRGWVASSCIRPYSLCMRRLTISIDEDLVRMAEAEVRAGRATSVSAWVADAIRAKARARADLVAELEALEQRDPTSPEIVASMARALGLPRAAVVNGLKARGGPKRRRVA